MIIAINLIQLVTYNGHEDYGQYRAILFFTCQIKLLKIALQFEDGSIVTYFRYLYCIGVFLIVSAISDIICEILSAPLTY